VTLTSWRQLSDRGEDVVLCVDFTGGRADAGFVELAAKAPIEASFLHIGRISTGPAVPFATHVERWVGDVRRARRPVRGVLGFCAGAGLATVIADALIEAGTSPMPVLLFDAITVTGTTLCDQFLSAVESSAEHLTADELADAHRLVEDLLARDEQDGLPLMAVQLVDRYSQLVTRLAARLRIGAFLDELVSDFAEYMSYLLIASGGTLELRGGTPVFLSSKDHEPDFEPVSHKVFQTSRGDLLRDAEVVEVVTESLDRH
jgi:hypothetical protein